MKQYGSLNLNCPAIELGQGTKTILAQILAEKSGMEMKYIHVTLEVNTQYDLHQWRTVASSTTFLAERADAVIDLKGIADCNVLERQGDQLIIGSAVSLNTITNSNLFPLLGQTVKQIADHTSRNKITIGGNINSQLMYRESILPLLIADAHVKITKDKEEEIFSLKAIFNKELALSPCNFLIQLIVDAAYLDLPYVSLKKT